MVELLIAIIIIGILVTIIVPVLSNRAADARIAAAKADMEAIANAESQVALDTGYIARLHVLDDSAAPTDGLAPDDLNDVVDTVVDEINNNAGRPDQLFLDAKTGVILPATLYTKLIANPDQFGWRGPYLTYHNKLKFTGVVPVDSWTYGSPLDPWGNPYFLFVAGQDITTGGTSNGAWLNERTGQLEQTFTYFSALGPVSARNFDRNTILSLGPDGVPGTLANPVLGTGDDLVRAF